MKPSNDDFLPLIFLIINHSSMQFTGENWSPASGDEYEEHRGKDNEEQEEGKEEHEVLGEEKEAHNAKSPASEKQPPGTLAT